MQIRRTLFDASQSKCLDRTIPGLVQEPLYMQVVELVVEVERRGVAACTFAFAEEHVFAPGFRRSGLGSIQTACCRVELWRRGKVEHVLRLCHMAYANTVENNGSFFEGPDRV